MANDEATRLQVGDTAPEFSLPTAGGGRFTLADHAGEKVIVYFYPAAMTPGCTTQACDFRDNLASLAAHGYTVVGISPDKVAKLDKFVARDELTFPLAADEDKSVLRAYGAFGEKKLYGKTVVGVIRSTIVVAPDGTVQHAAYNVRAKGHVAKLRRDLGIDDQSAAAPQFRPLS